MAAGVVPEETVSGVKGNVHASVAVARIYGRYSCSYGFYPPIKWGCAATLPLKMAERMPDNGRW